MTWTTLLPDKPGWYFWRAKKDVIVRTVHVDMNGGRLCGVGYGAGDNAIIKWKGEWAGPIEEPIEPVEDCIPMFE